MYSQRKFKTSLLFGIDEDTIDETNDAWISKRKDPAGMVLPLTKQVRWREALDMIRENHSLITPRVFRTTLEQDPPVEVIDYMLSITPTLASIPNEGPTALQVAVQQGACLDVVRAVLLACPFALCVTNSQNPMDPLSFAKRHRKEEKDLLELLSCPLSHWVVKGSAKLDAEEKSDPIHEKSPDIPYVATAATPQGNDEAIDRQELNNVKLVCAQVLKGHKKLSKQLKACEEKLKLGERQAKEDVLKKMKEEQEFHFRRQLIALDMRERAFKARVKAMEERCKNHCTEQLSGWTQSMDLWKAQAEHQWKEWKVMLDHDIDVNAHFRNDVCKWMEDHQFDECQKENQHKYDDDESTPILFATNLGEVSDSTPLCNSGSSSSDTTDDSMDDPDDGDSMKSCTYPRRPFRIRRRHPWKPPVRKWDNMTI